MIKGNRPVYLNLLKIRLPVMGMVSLAHRASGLLLFLAIPFSIYLLDLSVVSEADFASVLELLNHPFILLLELALLWSLAHHFFAGIRFLLIDADIGVDKQSSRNGAWLVIIAELLTMAICIGYYLL